MICYGKQQVIKLIVGTGMFLSFPLLLLILNVDMLLHLPHGVDGVLLVVRVVGQVVVAFVVRPPIDSILVGFREPLHC